MSATATSTAQDGIELDQLYEFVKALRGGDFSFRVAVTEGMSWKAEEVAQDLNRHLEQMGELVSEVSRVCEEVAVQGRLGPQAEHTFCGGPWKQMIDWVNVMACNLTMQLRDMNRSVTLLARGDATRPVTCECQGETLELKNAINTVLDRSRRG